MLEARIGRWYMFSCSLNDYNSTAVCTVLVRYGRNVQLCHSTAVSQYCTVYIVHMCRSRTLIKEGAEVCS